MEYTKETVTQFVKDVLVRNGFREKAGGFERDKCLVSFFEDHYRVRHYDEDFLEWMDWFSPDLKLTGLMGYLSWNDFIERGYSK
jgi:predicted oxidoreductase (fatty acid repression mutant protein)